MTAPVPTLDELRALSPRTDVEALRGGLVARLQAGEGSEPLLIHLAESDPVALAELLMGPRADGRLVPLALKVAAVLEDALSPPALYRRLVDLTLRGGWNEAARSVLEHVVFAHDDAPWVIALALRVEGREAGRTHLLSNPRHPRLGERCLAYARAGARAGLAGVAATLARPEPIAALAAVGDGEALEDACVAVLQAHPGAPIVPWLAACWSPDPEPLVRRVALRLDEATANRLLALCSRP